MALTANSAELKPVVNPTAVARALTIAEWELGIPPLVIKELKSGEEKRLEVTGIFIEIGLVPNSEVMKGLIELNQWGEVPITPACKTEIPGLYAAGDVTDVPEKQIVVAAGEGAKAALQAHRYLQRLGK